MSENGGNCLERVAQMRNVNSLICATLSKKQMRGAETCADQRRRRSTSLMCVTLSTSHLLLERVTQMRNFDSLICATLSKQQMRSKEGYADQRRQRSTSFVCATLSTSQVFSERVTHMRNVDSLICAALSNNK